LFADLLGELARGGDDKALNAWLAGVDFCKQRQAKSSRLASSRLRLRDQIRVFFDQQRNGLCLDGSRGNDAHFSKSLTKVVANAECGECVQKSLVGCEGQSRGCANE